MNATANKILFAATPDSAPRLKDHHAFGQASDKSESANQTSDTRKERQRSRNRGGCFCCRKRKIKCDERKPVCLKCEKATFVCCWPENGNASLSHENGFKLIKLKTSAKFINMNPVVAPISSKSMFNAKDQEIGKSVFFQVQFSERPTKITAVNQQKESKPVLDEDALIRQYIRESANGTIPSSINGMSGLKLNSEERMFYNAFVNGFIVSISNQLAHQKLLPGSIFVPTAMFDPLIQKLCMTCGASFLYRCSAGNDKDLLLKVKESNSLIVKELVHRLDEMPIMETREWILIYFTLQNNRQKFVYEGRYSQTINLISGVQAIKMWLETKKKDANTKAGEKIKELSHATVADAAPCTPSQNQKSASRIGKRNDHYPLEYNHEGDICSIEEFTEADSYILLDKLVDKTNLLKSINRNYSDSMILSSCEAPKSRTGHMVDMLEIEAKMLLSSFSYADKVKKAAEVTAFERTLLETFIFNYSGTLLTIDKSLVGCLTSPFELFDLIAPLLFVPIYKCAVPWMNNPTAGAALPMIELQAKIIWLSFKQEFDQRDLKIIHTIQKLAQYYTRPILPDEVWRSYPKNVSKKLSESCYVSEIVAKGVYLFSMKILNRSLSEGDEKVQEIVDSMFKILECISMHSQTSVIAKWSFLVIGCAILNEDQRVKLKKRLIGFVEALKTGSLRTSLIFLEAVWENGVGLNALFIEKYLDLLVI